MLKIENLIETLKYIKTNGFTTGSYIRTNESSEFFFNEHSNIVTINIVHDNETDGYGIYICRENIIYSFYEDVNFDNGICISKSHVNIRPDIISEEEFFQESTICDMLDLNYSNYKCIQNIYDELKLII